MTLSDYLKQNGLTCEAFRRADRRRDAHRVALRARPPHPPQSHHGPDRRGDRRRGYCSGLLRECRGRGGLIVAGNSERRPMEVKSTLSESHYAAMLDVVEALGLTQAGYIRQLILNDIVAKKALVEHMAEIQERPRRGRKRA